MLESTNDDSPDRALQKNLRLYECTCRQLRRMGPADGPCRPSATVDMHRLGRDGCRGACGRCVVLLTLPSTTLGLIRQEIWSALLESRSASRFSTRKLDRLCRCSRVSRTILSIASPLTSLRLETRGRPFLWRSHSAPIRLQRSFSLPSFCPASARQDLDPPTRFAHDGPRESVDAPLGLP
jgi:hypothetical protein